MRTIKNKKIYTLFTMSIGLVFFLGLITGCSRTYSSNGERIYFTATSVSGHPITYSGSISMMHSIACANCHGADGKGGTINMMMWRFETPDITWTHLTEEEHHEVQESAEEHEDHPPYTEETVRKAITDGVDPAGNPLDSEMPRWRMSQDDLDDLIEYLRNLE